MTAINGAESHGRMPWVAVVFSFFCTGLGHIYSGKIVKGMVLFLISFFFLPIALGCALIESSGVAWVTALVSSLIIVLVGLYAIVDCYFCARRVREQYELKQYNHEAIYVLMILAGLSNGVTTPAIAKMHAIEAFRVPASSMTPNIINGDRVLVNKAVYRSRLPERGEIVVFRSPPNRKQAFVKRVIGLPGDTVAVRGGEVYVNGQKLSRREAAETEFSAAGSRLTGKLWYEVNADRRYVVMLADDSPKGEDFAETKVPTGNCFVLGDNRDKSHDSRSFGFVPLGDVLGPVQVIYMPAESWSRFGKVR